MKKKENIKIGIIGLGMVGAPIMRWFSEFKGYEKGKDLFCYDADPRKNFSDDVSEAKIIFVSVPTPPNPDGSCDTSIVESAISRLPDCENRSERCIVIKSTVALGTTARLAKEYSKKGCFLFNPEFLTEAQAWEDFIRPDRQIVAAADEDSRKWISIVLNLLPAGSFQSPGVEGTYNFHEANSTEAELAKYVGNVFGAKKVSFSNIVADFCEILGVDYEKVRRLVAHDRRIGHAWTDVYHGNYRGFGGFCFPKDLNALIACGDEILKNLKKNKQKKVFSKALKVLKAVRSYNEALLESQGLTAESISIHDSELEKAIKNRKGLKHV